MPPRERTAPNSPCSPGRSRKSSAPPTSARSAGCGRASRPSTPSSPRSRSSPTPSSRRRRPSSSRSSRTARRSTTSSTRRSRSCREAGKRVLKMRHYDVQLIGGMVLHKRLDRRDAHRRGQDPRRHAALLPQRARGQGRPRRHRQRLPRHARRASGWGKLYNFLGLSVGTVVNSQGEHEKKAAYRSDITYGQNNEFGFDYLRDNMKFSALDYVQRELNYAIVDEVDSILIDEARTPLIISGQGEPSSHKYRQINEVIPRLRKDEHYVVDEKAHSVTLTDDGVELAQKLMGIGNLYDPVNLESLAHPEPVPARALALQARRELPRRRRRQGPHHRRVHRPRARRAALERRPAPGGRGEGERAHPGRDAHDGDDHLPEPLPPLQEALRDDRHRRHRGRPSSTRPTSSSVVVDPDQQAHGPRGPPGRRLQDRAREVHGGHRRDPRVPREGPAGARRHDERREEQRDRAASSRRRRSRTRSSTPSTTSARRSSSRRPGARAPSPSAPTWPAAGPTSSSAATRR